MPAPINHLADLGVGTPPPTPASQQPQADSRPQEARPLPADPVFQLPPIKATLEGDIAGFWASQKDAELPEYQLAVKEKQKLVDNGIAIFPMKNGGQAVFNPNIISPAQVVALDKYGKLDNFLKPLSALLGPVKEAGAALPASAAPSSPAGTPPQAPVAPANPTRPTPAAVSRPLAAADAKEYAAPTTRAAKRPTPGAGSLLQTLQVQAK